MAEKFDVILVGAGLANGLIALSLRRTHPQLKIVLLEKERSLTASQTWSAHLSDIDHLSHWEELFIHRWSSYQVQFPKFERDIPLAYASVTKEHFQSLLINHLGDRIRFDTEVQNLSDDQVVLKNGQTLFAKAVIDGRGHDTTITRSMGYQKFVGLDLQFKSAHQLQKPIIMDAQVPQKDGYRFLYTLPWSQKSLLVEDTYYSQSPHLDVDTIQTEVIQYAERRFGPIEKVDRIEKGILPIPFQPLAHHSNSVPTVGLRGDFFHYVTGYSLPDAIRVAESISQLTSINTNSVRKCLREIRLRRRHHENFYSFLNRLLFAADSNERYRILQLFYQKPLKLIQRFYRGQTSRIDQIHIFVGRPPMPISRAIRHIKKEPNQAL